MNKHTQGKWIVDVNKHTENKEVFVKIENKSAIARLFENNETVKSKEEAIANATLMAAAPDLLKALKGLREEVTKQCSIGSDPQLMEMLKKVMKANEAISKAEDVVSAKDTELHEEGVENTREEPEIFFGGDGTQNIDQ